jgi:hypothetical protein
VRELAAELTAGAATNYDKMNLLKDYLVRFPYTLLPQPVPEGVDFVDHFLFEAQEGYCVYYASALAVMARCEGIPTRYVEGYITPEEPDEESGLYVVDSQLAHAWVEAYFEGFGWVPFEATRPYAVGSGGELPALEAPVYEDESTYGDMPVSPNGPTLAELRAAKLFAAFIRWTVIILAAVVVITLSILGLRLRFRLRFERVKALPNREAVMTWFVLVMNATARYGLPIQKGETAHGYAKRMHERLKFRDHSIEELAEIFSRAAYSQNTITDEDVAVLKDCHYQMLIRLLASRTRVRLAIDRYLLLRY